jgi:hypothetical protein
MVSTLSYHVNKPVLVSIPPIFPDGGPRHCRLAGIEPGGLWLESEDLSRIAFADTEAPPAWVFVPFTQIAYLVGVPVAPPPVDAGTKPRRRGHKPLGTKSGKRRG